MSAVRRLHSGHGVDRFVEVGARGVVTDLARECLPGDVDVTALLRRPAGLREILAPLRMPGSPGRTIDSAASRSREPVRAPATPDHAVPSLPPVPDLVVELRRSFADALGCPEDALTDDAHLEATLGISPVTKTGLLVRELDRYGLPTPPASIGSRDFTTLPALADLMHRLAGQEGGRHA
jgi:hypothetical protein